MNSFKNFSNRISDFFFAKRLGSEVILKDAESKVKGWETFVIIVEMRRDEDNKRMYFVEFDDGWRDWVWEDEIV